MTHYEYYTEYIIVDNLNSVHYKYMFSPITYLNYNLFTFFTRNPRKKMM